MRTARLLLIGMLTAVSMGMASPASAGLPQIVPPPPLRGLGTSPPPEVSAAAWLVYDATFGTELAGQADNERRAVASTTKMMTALVALENSSVDDEVVISDRAAAIGEAEIGLDPGETWTVGQLVTAFLIRSANDAAMAVAEHVGGTVENFVAMMNARAAEMGLENTRFANPHGLDEPNHYSSAEDLLSIALAGMEHDLFAQAVATPETRMPDAPDGTERTAQTTNGLLRDGYPGIVGVKTGFTFDAGLTFVAAARQQGRLLYVVVLGSTGQGAHFADAAGLLDWGFSEFRLLQVLTQGEVYAQARSGTDVSPVTVRNSYDTLVNREFVGEVNIRPGLEGETPVVVAALGDDELTVAPAEIVSPGTLPTIGDALSWFGTYWTWLWGSSD